MKIQILNSSSLLAAIILSLVACSTLEKAPISENANPRAEIDRTSASLEEATRKQYDRLAPKLFQRAVDYRNSAAEALNDRKDNAKVLSDVAVAQRAIQEVHRIGEENNPQIHRVLEARRFAVEAQAPKFREDEFNSADNDLADLGEDMEKGKFKMDAEELSQLERRFSRAEIAARKRVELGSTRQMMEQATDKGAKARTPVLFELATAKIASAEQAIEISPHTASGYEAPLNEAKQSMHKLNEVLAIAEKNNTSEDAALTIWNQSQQLAASQKALQQANTQATAEQNKMQTELDSQHESIAALKSENKQYASEEELKQKIAEISKTFSPDEAVVMKNGTKLVVRLKKMQFSSGRSELNSDSFATLRKVDELIAAVPVKQITVEGHTDASGPEKKNKVLSEQRAESVKQYLVSQGLSESLPVDTEGYGSNRPLTSNKTKKGRAMNRRVDIVIDTPVVL